MQLARCAIEVYPYHQDVFAIVDLIAMQACAHLSCHVTEACFSTIKDVQSALMITLRLHSCECLETLTCHYILILLCQLRIHTGVLLNARIPHDAIVQVGQMLVSCAS